MERTEILEKIIEEKGWDVTVDALMEADDEGDIEIEFDDEANSARFYDPEGYFNFLEPLTDEEGYTDSIEA